MATSSLTTPLVFFPYTDLKIWLYEHKLRIDLCQIIHEIHVGIQF